MVYADNRFISFTSFIKNFSSSDDVNEACTIETNLPLPEVEIGKITTSIKIII